MRESIKAILVVVFIGCACASVLLWMDDHPNWPARIAVPLVGLTSLGVVIWSLSRRDKAPDFLRKVTGSYYERDGFCFGIVPRVVDGICFFDVYFQNRYSRPCRAMVVLRPSEGFFLIRRQLPSLTVDVDCEGGAFGVTRIPWAVSRKYQGKKQSIDIAANTSYPSGRGEMLRYTDGANVGKASGNFWKVMTLAGAMGGAIVLHRPAKMKFVLPKGVLESLPDETPIETRTLWRPGDPVDQTALQTS